MHALGKMWQFSQEKRFREKNSPQSGLLWWTRIWVTWLLKTLDAKPLTPGQFQWYPWNLTGMAVQMGYVEGRWHQHWALNGSILFPAWTRKMVKSFERLHTRKFSTLIFLGASIHGLLTHPGFRKRIWSPSRRQLKNYPIFFNPLISCT